MITPAEISPHLAHVCCVRQGYNFDQFAVYDDSAGDYVRDRNGCIHTWDVEQSIIDYLQIGKEVRRLAWIVRHLSGYVTYLRCAPANPVLTNNNSGAMLYLERQDK